MHRLMNSMPWLCMAGIMLIITCGIYLDNKAIIYGVEGTWGVPTYYNQDTGEWHEVRTAADEAEHLKYIERHADHQTIDRFHAYQKQNNRRAEKIEEDVKSPVDSNQLSDEEVWLRIYCANVTRANLNVQNHIDAADRGLEEFRQKFRKGQ